MESDINFSYFKKELCACLQKRYSWLLYFIACNYCRNKIMFNNTVTTRLLTAVYIICIEFWKSVFIEYMKTSSKMVSIFPKFQKLMTIGLCFK